MVAVKGEVLTVARDEISMRAPDDRCEPESGPFAPGRSVSVRFPKRIPQASPGFYAAFSDIDGRPASAGRLRLYLNLDPSGAETAMGSLTGLLNKGRVPFELKALADPADFARRDAVVLYFAPADSAAVLDRLEECLPEFEGRLAAGVPAFTLPLRPGVGLAEDPGGGVSFGQHRCGLVAEGLVAAAERGETRPEERLAAVEAAFTSAGVDLSHPWQRARSPMVDLESLAIDRFARPILSASRARPGRGHSRTGTSSLETAFDIGLRLARDAIHAQGVCTWLGERLSDGREMTAQHRRSYSALGSDLYGGASGVGLFLAELVTVTADEGCRRAAGGAARHALAMIEREPARHGFYAGTIGALWAVARIGLLLADDELVQTVRGRVRGAIDGLGAGAEAGFDAVDGLAGSITALLALSKRLEDVRMVQTAIRLGDELLQRSVPQLDGVAWNGAREQRVAPVGLAHGASAAAVALLDLGDVTGDTRYGKAALAAMQYERSWRSGERGWVEVRLASARARPETLPPADLWCYGSAGIWAARLAASDLIDAAGVVDDAFCAARQTATALAAALASPTDWSLCHGVAGCADVLMSAAATGPDEHVVDFADLPGRVAIEACRRWRRGELFVSVGSDRVDRPGLMVGAAGLGRFLLRQAGVPLGSVLIPARAYLEP